MQILDDLAHAAADEGYWVVRDARHAHIRLIRRGGRRVVHVSPQAGRARLSSAGADRCPRRRWVAVVALANLLNAIWLEVGTFFVDPLLETVMYELALVTPHGSLSRTGLRHALAIVHGAASAHPVFEQVASPRMTPDQALIQLLEQEAEEA